MGVYLRDIPLPQAWDKFKEALTKAGIWGPLGEELITLDESAHGRILSRPVWALISSPHYHACAMDGFAISGEDSLGASPATPVTLDVGSKAFYVDTGDPLPANCNAVVPIELIEALDSGHLPTPEIRQPAFIALRASLSPWSYIRPLGEDIIATQLVLPSGHQLRAFDLGAIAASGNSKIHVLQIPRIGIIPTGTELVPIGQDVKTGDIIEFNSVVLAAQVKEWGANPKRYPITIDKRSFIKSIVQQAANENDLVLLNAGSSAGSEDFSSQIVEELGELLVHGIAVRPGHPVILGLINRTENSENRNSVVPIIGVPGYPVSAALTSEIFVEPLISLWMGKNSRDVHEITGSLTRKVTSPAGDDDYMRVVVGKVGEKTLAAPLSRGSGVITSLVRADGISIIPRGVQGIEAGSEIKVRLYRRVHELENTIFAIGSHDMTLDLLAQFLSQRNRRFVSSNVGSLGGLIALRRGETHLAGCHLLDPESGIYNLADIRRQLAGRKIKLMNWVYRDQGLLVAQGNPKNIRSFEDLPRKGITFINRQRGAGTRVLLDFHLEKLKIAAQSIKGYECEEYTHLAVAAAVSSGRADAGLGINAAATALNLDFIPLYKEQYDLVIPEEHFEGSLLAPLLQLARVPDFRSAVSNMPGYDISEMGNILAI